MFMKKVNNDDKTRWLNFPDPAWLLEDFKSDMLQIHLKKPISASSENDRTTAFKIPIILRVNLT